MKGRRFSASLRALQTKRGGVCTLLEHQGLLSGVLPSLCPFNLFDTTSHLLVGFTTPESAPCVNGYKSKGEMANKGQASGGGGGCVAKAIGSRRPSATA